MKRASKPTDEKKRLDALYEYHILDTPTEGIFDIITSIASRVCHTPIGSITLIDENRQWFKSNIGLEETEIARDISFCSHTILQSHILEVPDAKLDDRFHDNPLVTSDPHIRFYAGMPLLNPAGYKLGALCVIDRKPKELTAEQKDTLKDLSAIVMKLFENKKEVNLHLQKLKQIENELQEHKVFSDQILNSALNGIITFDENGIIHTVNPAIATIFHYASNELIGKDLRVILPTFDYTTPAEKLYETTGLTKSNETLILELFISFMQCQAKKMEVGFIRDITQFKAVERMKNELIGITSHELRTPLTSIKGSLQLLLGGMLENEKKENAKSLLEIALKNCTRLIRLINDVLDIEKIESGKMMLNLDVLDLNSLIQEAIDANQTFAQKFKINIMYAEQIKNIYVKVDHDRLIQVLTNLLSNAIKFSPAGGAVTIGMAKKGDHIQVNISDQGPGISDEFKPKLFTKFSQASKQNEKIGTGLGLSISKAIIEELSGRIDFTTQLHKGTTFYFLLPMYTTI